MAADGFIHGRKLQDASSLRALANAAMRATARRRWLIVLFCIIYVFWRRRAKDELVRVASGVV